MKYKKSFLIILSLLFSSTYPMKHTLQGKNKKLKTGRQGINLLDLPTDTQKEIIFLTIDMSNCPFNIQRTTEHLKITSKSFNQCLNSSDLWLRLLKHLKKKFYLSDYKIIKSLPLEGCNNLLRKQKETFSAIRNLLFPTPSYKEIKSILEKLITPDIDLNFSYEVEYSSAYAYPTFCYCQRSHKRMSLFSILIEKIDNIEDIHECVALFLNHGADPYLELSNTRSVFDTLHTLLKKLDILPLSKEEKEKRKNCYNDILVLIKNKKTSA